MNALTASLDDAAVDYAHGPRVASDVDEVQTAFTSGARWAMQHVDWRVLAGSVPGHIFAGRMRVGDRVLVADVEGVIISLAIGLDRVRFVVRTDPGAEISFERPRMEAVMVLDVGRSS